MGREIKRVTKDFKWPMNMPWKGFINPYNSQKCTPCDGGGQNPETEQLYQDWYDFAKTGKRWCNNITQDEVDALVKAGRLCDLTHNWNPGQGWKPKYPKPVITAEQVNELNRTGFLHDSINKWICVETRAKRLGVYGKCLFCKGEGRIWFNNDIKKKSDEWRDKEEYEPPKGNGWQMWETVSEGSPISPVFDSKEELARWLTDNPKAFGDNKATYEQWLLMIEKEWVMSGMMIDGKYMSGVEAISEMEKKK